MDYDLLRQQGIRHLEQMAGEAWTDFNAHDPGITLLEQLCYALTDLDYRIGYEIPDLLASGGRDPYEHLYPPAEILTTRPVTLADLRRLVLDVDGVKNAWIEPAEETLHYDPERQVLTLEAAPPVTEEVKLEGLYRVLVEPDGDSPVQEKVVRRLRENRNLCEDFVEVKVLPVQPVRVEAGVEIGPVEDARSLLLDVFERIAGHISPSLPWKGLDEALAAGTPADEVFDGPRLDHGFLDPELVLKATRRTRLTGSDLIHEILDVPGVRAVRYVRISAGGKGDDWFLKLDPERTPRLDVEGSDVRLFRDDLAVEVDKVTGLRERAVAAPAVKRTLDPPRGRDRNVAHYHSIQHHLPALYGIAEMGLPASASPRRKAQAKQLKAYLTFFDQLLADGFAQLAHAKDLFSFTGEDPPRTYFTQPLDDPSLGLEDVLTQDGAAPEDGETAGERRNRFLSHLLARFAEQLDLPEDDGPTKRIRAKQTFLERYPRIGSARGTAFDDLEPRSPDNGSGLEERLRLELGLDEEQGEEVVVVEHVLLRPTAGDATQEVPLLAASPYKDPYSLQLSVVLPDWPVRFQTGFRQRVEKTLREETPAHLVAYVHWLDEEAWAAFSSAHQEWLERRRQYASGSGSHLLLRGARDRVVDLLGFAETYPLQDVAASGRLKVAFNTTAQIVVSPGQTDVEYELHDRDGAPVVSVSPQRGTGGETVLVTPGVVEDVTYKVLARKIASGREAYLHQTTTVLVGLDLGLAARIVEAELLDPLSPGDTAPRIVDHGSLVKVRITASQEGVDYRLVHSVGAQEVVLSAPDVRGDLGDVELVTQPIFEDTEIRIRATKVFDPSEGREDETDLLDVVLPLRVRADTSAGVTVVPSQMLDFGSGATIAVAGSQASASYRLYARVLPDRDFLYGAETPADGADVVTAAVPGQPDVRVARPPRSAATAGLEGFTAQGGPLPGNGGEIQLPATALTEDVLVLVEATKEHAAAGGATISSAVQLAAAALVLVRPDPAAGLALEVPVAGAGLRSPFGVSGGQPGVFYYFRRGQTGAERSLPAYFHKVDDLDPELNKGIGQLRIEVDFAVSRESPDPVPDLARLRPPTPLVEIEYLPLGISFYVRAVKARTRVDVPMSDSAAVPAPAAIQLDQAVVEPGAAATIRVVASLVGERYQPFLDGAPVGDASDGDGSDLVFTTAPVNEDTTFDVHVTRPDDPGIAVTRIVQLTVAVQPAVP